MIQVEQLVTELIRITNMHLSLEEVCDIYLMSRKHTCRVDTYEFYTQHLGKIKEFLLSKGVTSSAYLTNDVMFRYIDFEKRNGLKNNTINKRIRVLKQAFKYCEDFNYISLDPLRKFKLLPHDDVETVIIDEKIIDAMFEYYNINHTSKFEKRHRMLIYVLLDTGVRKNELRNILLKDIDFERKQIFLRFTKTNKNRYVFISDETIRVINDYVNTCSPIMYLVESFYTKDQLKLKGIEKILREIKKKLKLPREISISFHKFRHTYATSCLKSGADLEFVRKTLGHSSISTTQKYLHLSTQDLKEQHTMYSPIKKIGK